MKRSLFLLFLSLCLTSGCRTAAGQQASIPTAQPLTATSPPSETPAAAVQVVPTETASASPSPVPTTAPETPAASATPSQLPSPVPFIASALSDFTNVYSGPGTDYTLLAVLKSGFQVQVVGRDPAGQWLVVQLPRSALGWVPAGQLGAVEGAAGLPDVAAPPKPPQPAMAVPAPAVGVSPAALAPDAEYLISILHFGPRELVTIKVVYTADGSVEFKAVIRSRADGSAELILSTSSRAEQGMYILTAAGEQGSYAETAFFVGPPP